MHAEQMAEDFPVVSLDSDAWEAARFLVPSYVQDDPSPAVVKADDTIVEVAAVMARLLRLALAPR